MTPALACYDRDPQRITQRPAQGEPGRCDLDDMFTCDPTRKQEHLPDRSGEVFVHILLGYAVGVAIVAACVMAWLWCG